jgi:hypothetical protein
MESEREREREREQRIGKLVVRPPKEVPPSLERQDASRCEPLLPRGHWRMLRQSLLPRNLWRGELLPYGQHYLCTLDR